MPENIDWKKVWELATKDNELFPIKSLTDKTLSISCPTRFSSNGKLSIDITPSFNDNSISFELLVFNDNVDLSDIDTKNIKENDVNSFNKLADSLIDYEINNRLSDRFEIKSDGFKSDEEAKDALIDYINNKATESGRMFDDKLDSLNDEFENSNYSESLQSIRDNRAIITRKVERILRNNFGWKASKNEEFGDSVVPIYDRAGNLVAVVSVVDDQIIIDLSKTVTAKISMMQSDEEIEAEIVDDIDNAQEVLANKEIEKFKEVVSDEGDDEEGEYLESLARRVSKLESLYIKKRLRKF